MNLNAVQFKGCRSNCYLHNTSIGRNASVSVRLRGRLYSSSAYDNPALYTNEETFSEASYWDSRYTKDTVPFEWYRGYASLRPLVLRYLAPSKPLLQLGVGTSTIQHDMVTQDGFVKIVNVDYSKVAVEQQQKSHAGIPQLEYLVGDARDLTQIAGDGAFPAILDKGTLDALLCGDNDEVDGDKLVSEVVRVLQPGGLYFHVSHCTPVSRLRYLRRKKYGWSSIEVWEVGQQGKMHGPYHIDVTQADDQSLAACVSGSTDLPTAKEPFSHWLYCCKTSGQ